MVIVDKKFKDMPLGCKVQDVEIGDILHVVGEPRTTFNGTEFRLETDWGQRFHDNPLYYIPFV